MRKTSFSTKRATTSNDRLETPSKMIHDGHVLDHPHDHHPFCGWSSHSTSILSFGPPSERQAEFEADHHVSQTAIFAGKSTGRSRHEMTHDKLSLAFLDVFCLLDKKKEHLWCLSSWNCCFFAIIIIVVVVSLSSSLSCLSSRLGHVSPYFGRRRRQDYHSSDCITCHVRKKEKNTSYGLTRRVTRDHINEGHDSPSASRSQVSHFLDMCSSLEIYVIIDSCKKSRGSMMAWECMSLDFLLLSSCSSSESCFM